MARKAQSKGECAFCGQEIAKNAVSKHLKACEKWNEAMAKADAKKGGVETLYHLRVEAADLPEFWLDLEMRGGVTLKDLDRYLRGIWLECCGHMSQFSIGGWGGEEIPMKSRIKDVFAEGDELTHIYDFGTESVTLVEEVGQREGKPATSHPVALLVRNVIPECECIECGEPATHLCVECLNNEGVWGALCKKHAKKHPHDEYGEPIPLVNSPRLGLCGYDGPAKPPY